ncbi:MAG: hypothetical protein ACREVJ_10630 [Gammaproteobacteria bacterium]
MILALKARMAEFIIGQEKMIERLLLGSRTATCWSKGCRDSTP